MKKKTKSLLGGLLIVSTSAFADPGLDSGITANDVLRESAISYEIKCDGVVRSSRFDDLADLIAPFENLKETRTDVLLQNADDIKSEVAMLSSHIKSNSREVSPELKDCLEREVSLLKNIYLHTTEAASKRPLRRLF